MNKSTIERIFELDGIKKELFWKLMKINMKFYVSGILLGICIGLIVSGCIK